MSYAPMRVCLNGHRIDRFSGQDICNKCGEKIISTCPECGEDELIVSLDPHEGFNLPNYCSVCGELYPWADQASQFRDVESSIFDDELAARCVSKYEDGHYQSAVRTAFTILEERIRARGQFPRDVYGDDLMTKAFSPENGELAFGETGGEKQGVMFLYRGAMLSLRNPASHRFVEEVDEDYARDVIHTVNLLLRLVEMNTESQSGSESETELSQIPETKTITEQEETDT